MKICSYCGKQYPDDAEVCALDQQPLKGLAESSAGAAPPAPPGTRSPEGSRTKKILLLYVCVLGICPYVLFVLALGTLRFLDSQGEWKWMWLALLVAPLVALYVLPVAAVFGQGLDLESLAGHAKILVFYTVLSLAAASVHILLLRSNRKTEVNASPNAGPPDV
jgi:hypothetical protein